MNIADDIRNYLKAKKRNRSWFALESGLSQATISRILSGKQNSLEDETKYKIYSVIDGEGGQENMDERFKNKLIEQYDRMLKALEGALDENKRLSKQNHDLWTRLLNKDDGKTSANGK